MMLTAEEMRNLTVLVTVGAKAIAQSEPIDRAATLLVTADVLLKKVAELNTPVDDNVKEVRCST